MQFDAEDPWIVSIPVQIDGYFVCLFHFAFPVFFYFIVVCKSSLVYQAGIRDEEIFRSRMRAVGKRERD